MRVMGFPVPWIWSAAGLAQTMYKCLDDRRQVTYSNITCEKQGLRDGGPVAERTPSMPFSEPPKPAPRTEQGNTGKPPASAAANEAQTGRGATQVKPVSPLIEKLTK